jgi:hypothetical protein
MVVITRAMLVIRLARGVQMKTRTAVLLALATGAAVHVAHVVIGRPAVVLEHKTTLQVGPHWHAAEAFAFNAFIQRFTMRYCQGRSIDEPLRGEEHWETMHPVEFQRGAQRAFSIVKDWDSIETTTWCAKVNAQVNK